MSGVGNGSLEPLMRIQARGFQGSKVQFQVIILYSFDIPIIKTITMSNYTIMLFYNKTSYAFLIQFIKIKILFCKQVMFPPTFTNLLQIVGMI